MARRWVLVGVVAVVFVLLFSGLATVANAASPLGGSTAAAPVGSAGPASSVAAATATVSATAPTVTAAPSDCSAPAASPANSAANEAQAHFDDLAANATADGYPAGVLHPPVAQGASDPSSCIANNESDPAPAPAGVAYDGVTDIAGTGTRDLTLDSNSVEGILNVSSTKNLYPDSTAPTLWGNQLNVVLTNVTILGQKCAKTPCSATGSGSYSFWVQSLAEYNVTNQTLWFYDATWNFTSGSAEMQSSSLAGWSPWSSNYTGIWLLADTPYIHAPLPFTLALYVNSSVTAAGDQELWYNYSVMAGGQVYANGNYDYLIFNSQGPGPFQPLTPAPFEASAVTRHEVVEGYEFDVMIGADDGTNQLILAANATEQVKYCSIADCTPTDFVYSNVPAAVNYGSQTGETTVGLAVNYVGETALINAGPFIERGLWNYTGQTGANSGEQAVTNAITVSGSPLALTAQPYVFVFMENTNYTSQGYQWAPDQAVWYLQPGVYNYEVMLADYQEQTGTFSVGSGPTVLTAVLPYATTSGVYTPLWAFNNAQLAGISSSGAGTISSQYVLFNNPTSSCTFCGSATNANLSTIFYLPNDYHFTTYAGIIVDGTTAYVDINAPPTFVVHTSGTTYYYLPMWFYNTTHLTLAHASEIRGWPTQEEWDFYLVVPASQNVFPQGDVDLLDSTGDLIMSNTFVAIKPSSASYVSPDQIVLWGGGHNVIWGNTFRDPFGVAMGVTYAGIGEDEGNDLIYNNNFTIDNPVVWLPFNMPDDGECLPQCTAGPTNGYFWNLGTNTWNVTPQAASNVANTVNGFALSGNILGAGETTQGGNYYWNLGTSPNNYTTTPYVSRFYYSDWSNLYPLGCPNIQATGAPCGTAPPLVGSYVNGMQGASGDYAAYGPTVVFTESGLLSGLTWSVTLGAANQATSGSSTTFDVAYGTYTFSVAAPSGYSVSIASGSLLASGLRTITLTFAPWTTGGAAIPTLYGVYLADSSLQTAYPNVETSVSEFSSLVDWAGSVVRGGTSDAANQTLAPYGYWYDLMSVYDQRGDLQYGFPNAYTVEANYSALLSWAGQVVTNAYSDGDSGLLASYGYFYALAYVYNSRGDLQGAFPNALTTPSEWNQLVIWAGEVATGAFSDSSSSTLSAYNYYYVLAYVYNSRGDLQAAFPNALTNGASWAELVTWAQNVVNHKFPDSAYATLLPYASEYNAL